MFYIMASQYVWIGIAIGVFLAGIAIGYGVVVNSQPVWNQQMFNNMMQQNPQMMNQWNQQMMNDQTGRQQMMMSMMGNQRFMSDMMSDPRFQSQIIQHMSQNHDFTQSTIMNMMDDPAIRGQMIGHMLENQEFMRQMQEAMGNQTGSGGMGMMQ